MVDNLVSNPYDQHSSTWITARGAVCCLLAEVQWVSLHPSHQELQDVALPYKDFPQAMGSGYDMQVSLCSRVK